MGSGLAKAVRTKYPKVYQQYKETCGKWLPHQLLGQILFTRVAPDLIIANSFSQLNYGRDKSVVYTDEDVLIANLGAVARFANNSEVPMYVPYKVGCALGNGDWGVIERYLRTLDVTIVRLI